MWPTPQKTADLVTFTEEILNEQLHSLCIGHFMIELGQAISRKLYAFFIFKIRTSNKWGKEQTMFPKIYFHTSAFLTKFVCIFH